MNYQSTVRGYFSKFTQYFAQDLVKDLVSKLVMTLGVVLLFGGLYLMILNSGSLSQATQTNVAAQSVIDTAKWIPGIPFNIGDLSGCSISVIGLVLWVMGINLLLTGLGLWVRHRLARLIAIGIFLFASILQFVQFLLYGVLGSPQALVLLAADAAIAYLLFSAEHFS